MSSGASAAAAALDLSGIHAGYGDFQALFGVGLRVEGPMSALLLLVSGRPAALADLAGPGAAALPATFLRDAGPTRPRRSATTPDAPT